MSDSSVKISIEEMTRGRQVVEEFGEKFGKLRTGFSQTVATLLGTWQTPASRAFGTAADDFAQQMQRTEQGLKDIENRLMQTINEMTANREETQSQANRIANALNG